MHEETMTPGQAARLMGVDTKTITRWARAGALPCFKTLGGHRRFRRDDLLRIMEGPKAHDEE